MAMGFIADSLNRIQPSATIAVSTKARQLAAAGRDIISPVGAASPTSTPPRTSRQPRSRPWPRARRSTPTSTAFPSSRRRSCASTSARTALHYKPSQISVGTGGKQVIYNALLATLEPGRRGRHPVALLGLAMPTSSCSRAPSPVFAQTRLEDGYRLQAQGSRRRSRRRPSGLSLTRRRTRRARPTPKSKSRR